MGLGGGVGIGGQQVEPPFGAPALHVTVPVGVPATPLLMLLPASASEKAIHDGPRT